MQFIHGVRWLIGVKNSVLQITKVKRTFSYAYFVKKTNRWNKNMSVPSVTVA